MLAGAVTDFRRYYRQTRIPRYYSGVAHFCFTSLCGLAVIIYCASHLSHVKGMEWITPPATFLFANFIEYRTHRWPMHRPIKFLSLLFQRHTLEHHSFFTHEVMSYESTRDFKMVLFAPEMVVFFIGLHAIPLALLLYYLVSANVAYLFTIVAIGYFLTYEWLHLSYHTREDSWVGRLPFMRRLRRLHTLHHNPALMNRYNFNITFPIFDKVFGTLYGEHLNEGRTHRLSV